MADEKNKNKTRSATKRNADRRRIVSKISRPEEDIKSSVETTDSIIKSLQRITAALNKTKRRNETIEREVKEEERGRKHEVKAGWKTSSKAKAGLAMAGIVGSIWSMMKSDEVPTPPEFPSGGGGASHQYDLNMALDANAQTTKKKEDSVDAKNLLDLFNTSLDESGVGNLKVDSLSKAEVTKMVSLHESKSLPYIIENLNTTKLSASPENWKYLAKVGDAANYDRLVYLPKDVRDKTFKALLLKTIRNAMEENKAILSDSDVAKAIQQANTGGKANFMYALTNLMTTEGGYHPNLDGYNVYRGIDRSPKRAGGKWSGWARLDQLRDEYVKNNPGATDFPVNAIIQDKELNDSVADFYKREFWDANQLDKAPNNILASLAFDFIVNGSGAKTLKNAAKLYGVKGETAGDILAATPPEHQADFAKTMLSQRLADYSQMRNWDKYSRAWSNRIAELDSLLPSYSRVSEQVQLALGGMVEAVAGEAGSELVLPMNERGGEIIAQAVKSVFEENFVSSRSHSRVGKFSKFFEERFLPELKRRLQ